MASSNVDSFSLTRLPYLPENFTPNDLKNSWSSLIKTVGGNEKKLFERMITPTTIATSTDATDLVTALVLLNEIKDALVKRRTIT